MKKRMVVCLAVLVACSVALAGRGAGELSLDRSAVAALVSAGMPRSVPLSLAGLGELTLELQPPQSVEFIDGGVEGRVLVRVNGLKYATGVHVRYVPLVDPATGVVRLEPESAEPEHLPPASLDLAGLLPAVPLPRGSEWALPGVGGDAVRLRLHVQGLVVEEERLVVEFGVLTER
jgi:hypothetical protein